MADFLTSLDHLNFSPVNTVLLGTVLALLAWIGKSLVSRIERVETAVAQWNGHGFRQRLTTIEQDSARFREEEFKPLHELVQRHRTKIAVVKMKLGMDDDD